MWMRSILDGSNSKCKGVEVQVCVASVVQQRGEGEQGKRLC